MVVKTGTGENKYDISDIDEHELIELKKAIDNGSLPLKRTFYDLSFQIDCILKNKHIPLKR